MAKVSIDTLNKVKAEASQQIVKTEPKNVDTTNRAKSGRPKKEDKADQRVVILLTEAEMTKYQEFCASNGITQSGFIRLILKQQNAI
jgi:hypothetical protein